MTGKANYCVILITCSTCFSTPIGRGVLGRELATIHDYRQRLEQYRTDVSLVAAHEKAPWITVWVGLQRT